MPRAPQPKPARAADLYPGLRIEVPGHGTAHIDDVHLGVVALTVTHDNGAEDVHVLHPGQVVHVLPTSTGAAA